MTEHSYDPLGDGISNLTLIDAMGDDSSVTRAARVSLGHEIEPRTPEQDAKLIRYLLAHQHVSPFQACTLTVHVAAPLAIIRQWQRHWSWAYAMDDDISDLAINEVSRRYTSDDVQFYCPLEYRRQGDTNRQASGGSLGDDAAWDAQYVYKRSLIEARSAYEALLALGVAREQARFVLPQATYSRLYATASLRSALHFVGLRDAAEAQAEIVSYARCLGEIIAARWPVTWQAWSALREAS